MPDFTKIPEALDFIVGQAWLSPSEPVMAAASPPARAPAARSQPLGLRAAYHEIAAILRRVG